MKFSKGFFIHESQFYQINHMFETEGFPDEPETGWTNDTNNYGFTYHIHTKDLVTMKCEKKSQEFH